jgi:hypothetical protein
MLLTLVCKTVPLTLTLLLVGASKQESVTRRSAPGAQLLSAACVLHGTHARSTRRTTLGMLLS